MCFWKTAFSCVYGLITTYLYLIVYSKVVSFSLGRKDGHSKERPCGRRESLRLGIRYHQVEYWIYPLVKLGAPQDIAGLQ